jgi:hypothetical protein
VRKLFVPEYQCENYDHFQPQQLAPQSHQSFDQFQQNPAQQTQDPNQQQAQDQQMPLFPRRTNPAAALSAAEHRRAIAGMEVQQQQPSAGNIRDRHVT